MPSKTATLILSALLVSGSSALLASPAATGAAPVPTPLVTGLPDFTDLVDKVSPAVVNIRTTERVRAGSGMPGEEEMQEFLRRFFGGQIPRGGGGRRGPQQQPEEQEVQRGVGSGFIISDDGFVLTNAHVVEGADEVTVTLNDRREFKAKVLGADRRSDVALLKLAATGLPYLRTGDSSKIRVGEWVVAIGSPFNLDNTVTAGIISAKSRDTGEYLPLIQSDVAVNPGNSGGPLINMRGEVIGINSQIATLSGAYNGISFAVPIDEVIRVADQLKKTGRVTRGRLGVQISEVTRDVAESLGLGKARGAEVSMVEQGGPAEKGGIKVGDIILKFNGQPIETTRDLPRLVGASKVGSRATVTVWRRGTQLDVPVTIVELQDEKTTPAKPQPKKPAPSAAPNVLGLNVSGLSAQQHRELGIEGGVLVENAQGNAATAGIRPGDLILQVNNAPVTDEAQFNGLIGKLDPKKPVALLVRRENVTQYVVIKPRQ
ncbi:MULTISPECIES: Do family serine endopeptidase [unclassified Massilia]|uniref:Do family serine endopeptidase n=1 Tax=unclassified Massilia TaxID=2609279 RepID=UPI001B813B46|nr:MULTISPECIES: Do family serine endopeptidase [unclassified Massilia]MBQ5938908.1 Do family serine endopeptidase [Massilia sp. AB1]MBQ5961917.1 Do family serine endopeptidase [Massilia sp. ZL223]